MANNEDMMSSTSESSSAQATPGEMSLATRIGGLPQELYDEILDLTILSFETNGIIEISEKYKPPKQLQINRARRRKVAQHYYSSHVFRPKNTPSGSILVRWLKSLPPEHTFLIGTVSWGRLFRTNPCRIKYILHVLEDVEEILIEQGEQLHRDCLKAGYECYREGKHVVRWISRSDAENRLLEEANGD